MRLSASEMMVGGGGCERSGLPRDGVLLNQAPLLIAENRSFTRPNAWWAGPRAFLLLCLHLVSLSVRMLIWPGVSTAWPRGHCTCCTIQDLRIWKLTTARVHETRPRVSCLLLFVFFFLESWVGHGPMPGRHDPCLSSDLFVLPWGEARGVGILYQFPFFCLCVGFCRSFVPFIYLSSFNPENQKYTKK
ncbi:hypothetical protein Hdeb2414_s0009g00315621 [Helianthus debilis subsp. tardiflorus]